MSSNDNHPKTPIPKGVTSYLNQNTITLAAKAVAAYRIDKMKSADLFINATHGQPEAWIYLYRKPGVGKFKINFLGNLARLSVSGFASYFGLDLPLDKSVPFDLREITPNQPIDRSYEVLPDKALAFTWPLISNPRPRKIRVNFKNNPKRD